MKHYYLFQLDAFTIVESAEEMPVMEPTTNQKFTFDPWLRNASKYPIANLDNEKFFIDLAFVFQDNFDALLKQGVKIPSENVEIKIVDTDEVIDFIGSESYPVFGHQHVAYFVPSAPAVVEESKNDLAKEIQRMFEYGKDWSDVLEQFHITRIKPNPMNNQPNESG
jgi:hypothetical protein